MIISMGDPEVATHSNCLRLRMKLACSYQPFLCLLSFNNTTTKQKQQWLSLWESQLLLLFHAIQCPKTQRSFHFHISTALSNSTTHLLLIHAPTLFPRGLTTTFESSARQLWNLKFLRSKRMIHQKIGKLKCSMMEIVPSACARFSFICSNHIVWCW